MHRRTPLPDQIRRLATSRQGIVTRAELLATGLAPNAIVRLTREWRPLARGLYAMPGNHDPWLQRVHAGLALGGDGSAAFGATALALWGLGERPNRIEILSDKRRPAPLRWLTWRRDEHGARRIVDVEPRRVCIEDAVLDAAAGGDRFDALATVSRALQEQRTTPERLVATLHRRGRLRHRKLLLTAIGDSAAGAHSAFEHLYLDTVERAHGLPPMDRQFTVPATGHDADGAYERKRLLIELDGVRYHDRAADEALDIQHGEAGWRTERFTFGLVDRDPCAVARLIAAILEFRDLVRCPRCP